MNRASKKLMKWDSMASKIQDVKERKELLAAERDVALKSKLDKAIKVKEEMVKYQKEQTLERAKKWEERKKNHEGKLTVKLNQLNK